MSSFWVDHLGKHLVIVSWETANEMRKHTQVYHSHPAGWLGVWTPEWYRKNWRYELWGRWNDIEFAVEVEVDKPEYTPDG